LQLQADNRNFKQQLETSITFGLFALKWLTPCLVKYEDGFKGLFAICEKNSRPSHNIRKIFAPAPRKTMLDTHNGESEDDHG